MTESGKCCVCDAALETVDHLFSECRFSHRIFQEIGEWCGTQLPKVNCIRWWVRLRERSASRKKLLGTILATCVYDLWHTRNVAMKEHYVAIPDLVIKCIKNDVIWRVDNIDCKCDNMNFTGWIERLRMGRTG